MLYRAPISSTWDDLLRIRAVTSYVAYDLEKPREGGEPSVSNVANCSVGSIGAFGPSKPPVR